MTSSLPAAAAALALGAGLAWFALPRVHTLDSASAPEYDASAEMSIEARREAMEERLTALDTDLRHFPDSADLLVERGRTRLQVAGLERIAQWLSPETEVPLGLSPQRLEAARADFYSAMAVAPVDPQAYLSQAILLLAESEEEGGNREKLASADALVELAIRLAPTVPPVRFRAGRYFLERGRIEAALENLSMAVDVSVRFSGSSFRLLSSGRFPTPTQLATSVPGSALFWRLQGREWRDVGALEESLACFSLAAERNPVSQQVFRDLTDLLWVLRRPERLRSALRHYQDAVGPYVDVAEVHLQQARLAHLSGQGDAACHEARLANDAAMGRVRYTDLAALILLLNDQVDEAIQLWTELLDRARRDSKVARGSGAYHRSLGMAFEKKNLLSESLRHYRIALRLNPEDDNAARRIEVLTSAPAY